MALVFQVPAENIVPVHGSIGQAGCEKCGADADYSKYCDAVKTNIKDIYGIDPSAPAESSNIFCEKCGAAAVKPRTVLFGAQMPSAFFDAVEQDLPGTQLLLVIGTSLVVHPAASIPQMVDDKCVRVYVNRDRPPSEFISASSSRDVVIQADADEALCELADRLGWLEELQAFASLMPEQSQKTLELYERRPSSA
jgi:NAD-dependent histone deacetylase SIR2